MKCSFRYCFCSVESQDEYCCSKCKTSDRSERPSEKCRCGHDRCDEDAQDDDDDEDDDDEEDVDDVGADEHAIEN